LIDVEFTHDFFLNIALWSRYSSEALHPGFRRAQALLLSEFFLLRFVTGSSRNGFDPVVGFMEAGGRAPTGEVDVTNGELRLLPKLALLLFCAVCLGGIRHHRGVPRMLEREEHGTEAGSSLERLGVLAHLAFDEA
jgi:hypothetical protein